MHFCNFLQPKYGIEKINPYAPAWHQIIVHMYSVIIALTMREKEALMACSRRQTSLMLWLMCSRLIQQFLVNRMATDNFHGYNGKSGTFDSMFVVTLSLFLMTIYIIWYQRLESRANVIMGWFSFGENCAAIQVMSEEMKLSLQKLQTLMLVFDTITRKTLLSQPLFE